MNEKPTKEPIERAYLSVAQTAKYLGLCTRTVRRAVNSGALPCLRLGGHGGQILIPIEALKAKYETPPVDRD